MKLSMENAIQEVNVGTLVRGGKCVAGVHCIIKMELLLGKRGNGKKEQLEQNWKKPREAR